MNMFDIRMAFLNSLKKLNATQSSIQRVVGFAIKHFAQCGDDLWDCVLEECQKLVRSFDALSVSDKQRSIKKLGAHVLRGILESWRTKRVLDSAVIEEVVRTLDGRSESLHEKAASEQPTTSTEFTREEILRRFEEDRERHKLLRQKRWVLPIPSQIQAHQPRLATALLTSASASTNVSPASPASPAQTSQIPSHRGQQQSSAQTAGSELALDIEFENAWETTSDWNEDDEEAVREENALCFPGDFPNRSDRMDIS